MWEGARQEHFLRGAVLKLITELVSVQSNTFDHANSLVPVLAHTLDLKAPDNAYLLEDGLALWLTTLRACPSLTPVRLPLRRERMSW